MASAFGHMYAGLMIGKTWQDRALKRKVLLFSLVLAVLPDIDTIGYAAGVDYHSMWGHRGFTHSITFAALMAFVVSRFAFHTIWMSRERWRYLAYFFVVSMSHGLLDACTTGGMGVGFFIPFSSARYFFLFHPIKVSPIGVTRFLSERGLSILVSEALWIGVPFTLLYLLAHWYRRTRSSMASGKNL